MCAVRFILIAILFLAACTSTRPPESSFFEVVGDQTKRVSTITAMVTTFRAPPTPIIDAQFVEEKIGNDEFGPADYRAFTRIEIAPADVAAWQAILTPLDRTPAYQSPPETYAWWVDEEDFDSLQFYTPDTLTGRSNGWVAIDAQSGKIFIYSFTT